MFARESRERLVEGFDVCGTGGDRQVRRFELDALGVAPRLAAFLARA
jgi:hypothetical protein